MTRTIGLTPELEARLKAAAAAQGTDEAGAVLQLIGSLPEVAKRQRPRIRGKYAGMLTDSETLARQKQEEIAREECVR